MLLHATAMVKEVDEESDAAEYLLLVVHRDLDEDHGVGQGAHLLVLRQRVALVNPLRPAAEHLGVEGDEAHGDLLHQHHHRHDETDEDGHPQQRHGHPRAELPPQLAQRQLRQGRPRQEEDLVQLRDHCTQCWFMVSRR